MGKNFYQILEVREKATTEEIKEAFRRLSKSTHPDNNQNKPEISDLFQTVNEANHVLSNHHRRREYDKELKHLRNEKWQKVQKLALIVLLSVIVGYIIIDNVFNKQPFTMPDNFQAQTTANSIDTNLAQKTSTSTVSLIKHDTIIKYISQPAEKVKMFRRDRATPVNETSNRANLNSRNKELSEKEMQQILVSINLEKTKNKESANCIKIRRTMTSNVENWAMLPVFLRQNGYIISGREIVNADVKGVVVESNGECLVLTIGNFKIGK